MKTAVLLGSALGAWATTNDQKWTGVLNFQNKQFQPLDRHCFGSTQQRVCETVEVQNGICKIEERAHFGQCLSMADTYSALGVKKFESKEDKPCWGSADYGETVEKFCINDESRPGGCFIDVETMEIYYNYHALGNARVGDTSMCYHCNNDAHSGMVHLKLKLPTPRPATDPSVTLLIYQVSESHSKIHGQIIDDDKMSCDDLVNGIQHITSNYRAYHKVTFDAEGEYMISKPIGGANRIRDVTLAIASCDKSATDLQYHLKYDEFGAYDEGTGPYSCTQDEASLRTMSGEAAGLVIGIIVLFIVILAIIYFILDQFRKVRGAEFRHAVIKGDGEDEGVMMTGTKEVQHFDA